MSRINKNYRSVIRYTLIIATGFLFFGGIKRGLEKAEIVTKDGVVFFVTGQLYYPALVNQFYQERGSNFFWFSSTGETKQLRQQLISIMDSSDVYGLSRAKYHYEELNKSVAVTATDSSVIIKLERIWTDAAIALMQDIFGYQLRPWVGFDAVSAKLTDTKSDFIVASLLAVRNGADLVRLMSSLEPYDRDYHALKQELKIQINKRDKKKIEQLISSMNLYRWVHHFRMGKFIVVNIPSATLRFYEGDSVALIMKTVVGKPSTPTPTFSAYFSEVILYPYWYVPRSIIFKEFLPHIKRNPSWLDAMNLQVVDSKGKVLNHHKINWSQFDNGYFPYILRQSTGCDNALGVLKFNINDPYGVYLHDTNNKNVFLASSRFFSHGCIRIEKPLELGSRLLRQKLDTTFLQSCFKDQKPIPLSVGENIPVFVVYMTVETDMTGKVKYYRDVYKLFK